MDIHLSLLLLTQNILVRVLDCVCVLVDATEVGVAVPCVVFIVLSLSLSSSCCGAKQQPSKRPNGNRAALLSTYPHLYEHTKSLLGKPILALWRVNIAKMQSVYPQSALPRCCRWCNGVARSGGSQSELLMRCALQSASH